MQIAAGLEGDRRQIVLAFAQIEALNISQITKNIFFVDFICLVNTSENGIDITSRDEDRIDLWYDHVYLCLSRVDAFQIRQLILNLLLFLMRNHHEYITSHMWLLGMSI